MSPGWASGLSDMAIAVIVWAPGSLTCTEKRISVEDSAARKSRSQTIVEVPVQPEPRS